MAMRKPRINQSQIVRGRRDYWNFSKFDTRPENCEPILSTHAECILCLHELGAKHSIHFGDIFLCNGMVLCGDHRFFVRNGHFPAYRRRPSTAIDEPDAVHNTDEYREGHGEGLKGSLFMRRQEVDLKGGMSQYRALRDCDRDRGISTGRPVLQVVRPEAPGLQRLNYRRKKMQFCLPMRPYGVIDAINRVAAATGSWGYAQAASDADYNGHFVKVYYNGYRGYWLAEYTWGGRNVLRRGSLADCLAAAKKEYDRGALGCTVVAYKRDEHELEIDFEGACRSIGMVEEDSREWYTDLHKEVGAALRLEKSLSIPATAALIETSRAGEGKAEYDARIDQLTRKRNFQVGNHVHTRNSNVDD